MRLALARLRTGRDAVAPAQEAAATLREIMGRKPDGVNYQKSTLFAIAVWGQALAGAKRYGEAVKAYEEAAALGEELRAKEQAPLSNTIAATYVFDHFGDFWKSRGDLTQARQWFERSRQAWAARAEQTPAVRQRRQRAEEKLNGLQS